MEKRPVSVLATKLYIPPVRPELVSRSRLIERLDEGLRPGRKLILVSAPAGYGKTTLLGEWVRRKGEDGALQTAWLSLDEGDNDPARFLAYLVAALQTMGEDIGQGVLDALQSPQLPSVDRLLTRLINQVSAVPGGLILVLDDYHLITAQLVHDAMAFLLDHLPGNLHPVIVTRSDPPLPIARLRGRRQLVELRQADLHFAPEEAAAFLERVVEPDLSAAAVAALASRTEGWIAGLQMAALALQGALSVRGEEGIPDFITSFTGSHRYILDYLLEEVLYREAEPVQAFLLQTSILERLCASLCSAVVGVSEPVPSVVEGVEGSASHPSADSQAILEHIESSNLFIVPLDDERCWYRYHRLFADLLRSRLQQAQPDLVSVLHHRASGWFERNGLMAEAIDHALAAGDLGQAADLIEREAEATLMRGEIATFLRWIGALPDDLVHARPALCILYAWMLLWQGQSLRVIESLLQSAEEGDERVAGRVAALRGLMAALQGQVGPAVELCRRALAQLPEEDRFVSTFATWLLRMSELVGGGGPVDRQSLDDLLRMSQRAGNVMLSVLMGCNHAEISMREGHLHQAAATYQGVLELATDAQGRRMPIAGQALIGLGELSREWGDLDVAERYLLEGIELTEQWSEVGPLEAYIALARVRQAQGNVDGSQEAIRKAQELAVKFDLTDLDDLSVAMFQARMWVAQGDLEPARHWAEMQDLYQYIESPLQEGAGDSYAHRLRKYELLVLARLLIAQERPAEALTLLDSLVSVAEWRWRPGMLIEIYALQALAYRVQGDTDRAMAALERALSLAEPEGYVRIFADEGEPMAQLLQEAAGRGIAPRYVDKLLAALGVLEGGSEGVSPPYPHTQPLLEPLSERELEVLRLLSAHLSSTEIAEKLFISVNTVRFHIKNVYSKLDVHRRSGAIRRAEELGLL